MTKAQQLGMNPSTASHRLVKDLLFHFVVVSDLKCHRCGEEMSRDDFSIDHIKPWMHSENPVELYFDLTNIAFSHLVCNTTASRPLHQKYYTTDERRLAKQEHNHNRERVYDPKERRERYLRLGT